MIKHDFIPVNEPLLNGNEKKYLDQCIDTGWISSEGPFVKRFEKEFASRMGRKYGIAVTNGSSAIDVAVDALGIGPDDEVILPTFTIISCILQIMRSGAKPVLVDSDPITWNMDVSKIEEKVTSKTKAIMVVHIYGLPVDMDPVLEICKKYKLKLIEDSAEQIGQTYKEKPCGSFGDISTVSFYPNKHITTGEGGMVLTDSENLANICRESRNLCFMPNKRFIHERFGWNFRMTNLQAALGLAQLERLDQFIVKKRWIGNMYNELLSDVPDILLPLKETEYAKNIYWVYGLVLDKTLDVSAKEIMDNLNNQGIGCRPFFYPMHQQPVLNKLGLFKNESHPVAEKLYQKGLYLPSGLNITEEQIVRVSTILKNIIQKLKL
ncbi:DegT/DnrJ/EryC1/StrS family aminotransferase [Candidatus Pelagibacter sp.]|jgi:perosamine synthetase|nr:DegT/DnrJ/EryC1/StrS family aminotransferase [Candidatus Pelagibacter sp.]